MRYPSAITDHATLTIRASPRIYASDPERLIDTEWERTPLGVEGTYAIRTGISMTSWTVHRYIFLSRMTTAESAACRRRGPGSWSTGTGSHPPSDPIGGGRCEWLAVTVFAYSEPFGTPSASTWTSPLAAAHCGTGVVVYRRLDLWRHGLATLHSATDDNRTGRSDASTHRHQSSRQAVYASLWTWRAGRSHTAHR
jgi:hypothetical protein